MGTCRVCQDEKSAFIMNNKTVCFQCDELLFDLEMECEEEVTTKEPRVPAKPVLRLVEKKHQ